MNQSVQSNLKVYYEMLLKWQRSVNLVAPSTLNDAWARHFEDSLQLLPFLKDAKVLADIGSGAGFPGLVLGVARPDMDVHLLESDGKKAAFLAAVSRETAAANVYVHNARIEKNLPALRADVVSARALAPLIDLLDMSESQWRRAEAPARLVLLKGADWVREVQAAEERYAFTLESHASRTSADGRILCISDVRKRGFA